MPAVRSGPERRSAGPSSSAFALLVGASMLIAWAGLWGCGETELIASSLLPDDNPPVIGEGGLGSVPTEPPPYEAAPTLFTFGGKLRDHCGEEIALRGVAELIAWTPGQDGDPEYFEIAKTGANAVRIMWRDDAPTDALAAALGGAQAQGLIPVVELQEGTFRNMPEEDALALTMAFWTDPEVLTVLRAHQTTLILEISSWVSQSAFATDWVRIYSEAIGDLRAAGLLCPIAIVHPSWSQDPVRFPESMAALLAADPVGNVLSAFDLWSGSAEEATDKWAALGEVGVAAYISEFSSHQLLSCPMYPIDGPAILDAAQAAGGSWFAWAWGSLPSTGCPGFLALTTDGTFATLTAWGTTIALDHRASLARTAVALTTTSSSMCPQ